MEKTRADGLPLPQRYGAILTIIIGISMAVLDGAIANVALPTIATDLHASPASSIWIGVPNRDCRLTTFPVFFRRHVWLSPDL